MSHAAVLDQDIPTRLAAKPAHDAVPESVWRLVAEALAASLHLSGTGVDRDRSIARAVVAVDRASWALAEDVSLLVTSAAPVDGRRVPSGPLLADPARALHRAQLLVARLLGSSAPTSPTLLKVRLDRLARALVAGLQPA